MVRVRTAVASLRRKKRVMKEAKGQFGRRSTNFRQAIKSVIKGLTYQYRDRKVRKGEFRRLWIVRINAACKEIGISYSRFINGLSNANIVIDRKMLSEMAIHEPEVFSKLVEVAKNAKPKKKETVAAA